MALDRVSTQRVNNVDCNNYKLVHQILRLNNLVCEMLPPHLQFSIMLVSVSVEHLQGVQRKTDGPKMFLSQIKVPLLDASGYN